MKDTALLQKSSPHFDELYNLSLRLTCSYRTASKMMLHIFREAVKFYDYHEPAEIRNWLLRIALNLYGRFYLLNDITINEQIDDNFNNLSPYIDKKDVINVLKKFSDKNMLKLFASVPSDLRIVLVLHEVLNMRYDEISVFVDVPVGTVIMRLNRARKFIFNSLQNKI